VTEHNPSKRQFIKTVTYVAPAILTLKVAPSFASTGSGRGGNNGGNNEGNNGTDGDYKGGNDNQGGSADQGNGANGPDNTVSAQQTYSYKKKKRNWWWPFS